MAYSEADAERMRAALKGVRGIAEQKMFGGICFLLRGNMLCGIGEPGFMFRVGKEQERAALKRPGASPIVFNGRRLGGLVWVKAEKCKGRAMTAWIGLARKFVGPLPAKKKGKK
jgi:hypothetical protein